MSNPYDKTQKIHLIADGSKSRRELHHFLLKRGYRSVDQYYFLGRPDIPQSWQALSIFSIELFLQGSEIREIAEEIDVEKYSEWDELRINYLLDALPSKFIKPCAIECENLAAVFNLSIELNGIFINPGNLQPLLQQAADQLSSELDEPGSESLAILRALYQGR